MDRQMSKIMNVLFMAMLLWFVFSVLSRINSMLPLALTAFALANIVTAILIREYPHKIAQVSVYRFIGGYMRFVCRMIGDELPKAAKSKTSTRRMLLQKPEAYRIAAKQAKQLVRGHDEVIDCALNRVRENQTLRVKRRGDVSTPLAAFLLVGHDGVGKRYLSRVLAKLIFGSGAIDVFDCSRTNGGVLLGTNDQPGGLIQLVRQRPHRAIVFEEIEQANADTLAVIKGILSKGIVQLPGTNRTVRFDDTLIFLTTTKAAETLHSYSDKQQSGSIMLRNSIEILEAESGIDKSILSTVNEVYLCKPSTDLVKAEVLSLLLQKECRSHNIQLSYVDPGIIASQVCLIGEQEGFKLVPQQVNRLLRRPLVAVAAEGHESLSLRVRRLQKITS